MYLFVGADKLRFKRQIIPGDQLMLRANVLSEKRGIWKFAVSADVDGKVCASATILCADR
jgi:3-hydroxyacyl-[acyl-carrier-protein] dehydratase